MLARGLLLHSSCSLRRPVQGETELLPEDVVDLYPSEAKIPRNGSDVCMDVSLRPLCITREEVELMGLHSVLRT
jgi:hypothetical protein